MAFYFFIMIPIASALLNPTSIAGGISALGSVVGGLIGQSGSKSAAKTQYKIAQETNAMNYRIAQENNAFNERMVDKMNVYNSAKNQRKRLEEAGLNPYLMMDGGSAGTASTAPTADTSGTQVAPDVAGALSQGSQLLNLLVLVLLLLLLELPSCNLSRQIILVFSKLLVLSYRDWETDRKSVV